MMTIYASYYHLGSWTTLTDPAGNIEQAQSFDAWGNMRDPDTWQNPSGPELVEVPMFDRGYTGHEHIPYMGYINMNGDYGGSKTDVSYKPLERRCFLRTSRSGLSMEEKHVSSESTSFVFSLEGRIIWNNPER